MDVNKLQNASYLDILFEGRNKKYGSYELRTNYPKRIKRSMLALVVVGLLIGGYYGFAAIKPKPKTVERPILKEVTLAEPPPIDETKPPPPPPPAAPPPPVKPTVKFTPPVIKENEEVREDEVIAETPREETPGPKTQEGDVDGIEAPIDPGSGTGNQLTETPARDPNKIETVVDQQPEFPGDVRRYLADKLQYPDQAREAGIEGRVVVKFVVDEEGRISQATIAKSLGGGCDEEALRVVRGMPRWKPARLNGEAVKAYFQLPIKFTLE